MDLKALMQKLEAINNTQIVTESVETKQVITESVAAPARQTAEPVFKSSIARSLAEEFGYELDEAEGASPWANDPAKDAAWKALSPEDQKWLGGADPTDPYILARAPNKGKPAASGAAASPAAPATSAATGVGNPGEEAAAQAAADKAAADQLAADTRQDAEQSDIAGQQQAAAEPASAGGSTPDAAPAPAASTTKWPVTDAEIKAFQQANGLKADGLIGGKTMAALQKAGATPPPGFTPVPNKAAGGQAASPKAAASLGGKSFKDASAAANAAGGQAASPAAPNQSDAETARLTRQNSAGVAAIDAQLEKYKKYPQSNAQIIARLEKEKAAMGSTAASPAAPAPAKAAPKPGELGSGTFDPNAKPAAPAGSTNTSSNQSVQGTMKMGKPDGPIQFNGKNVNPGDPEYAAASQALIAAQQKSQQARQRPAMPGSKPSTAPVAMGATNADKSTMEENVYREDQSLVRIKSLAGL